MTSPEKLSSYEEAKFKELELLKAQAAKEYRDEREFLAAARNAIEKINPQSLQTINLPRQYDSVKRHVSEFVQRELNKEGWVVRIKANSWSMNVTCIEIDLQATRYAQTLPKWLRKYYIWFASL